MITNFNQFDLDKTYSYADYLLWMFKERIELFNGKISKMSLAPSLYHQKISLNLTGFMWNNCKNQSCNLCVAPFDDRLLGKKKSTNDKEIYTVVQPDLRVICDENKID